MLEFTPNVVVRVKSGESYIPIGMPPQMAAEYKDAGLIYEEPVKKRPDWEEPYAGYNEILRKEMDKVLTEKTNE